MSELAQTKHEPDDAFAHSPLDLAHVALRLAERYGTPPVPKIFEFWYLYAAGKSEAFNSRVDMLLKSNGEISSYDAEQIYDRFHAANDDDRSVSRQVAGEMKTAASLINRQIHYNDHHAGVLTKSNRSMAAARDAQAMRTTMESLMRENGRMHAETLKLSRHLDHTRQRLQQLNAKLEVSRLNELKDELTGVWNRRGFERGMSRLLAEAQKSGQPLSLVMADLDHFKKLNDTYGHQVGDDVLRFVAGIFGRNVKGRDLVTRYGGEEFAILLPATSSANALNLIAQIVEALAKARMMRSKDQQSIGMITCSFGLTETDGNESAEKVIERADKALYSAKANGRNRVMVEMAP